MQTLKTIKKQNNMDLKKFNKARKIIFEIELQKEKIRGLEAVSHNDLRLMSIYTPLNDFYECLEKEKKELMNKIIEKYTLIYNNKLRELKQQLKKL